LSALLPLHLVAAVAKDGCIGVRGQLPWRLPEDMTHFRALTLGHAIIMGRKTLESIGKALPERRSIVITTRGSTAIAGVEVAGSLEEALALARQTDPEPRVIGGAQIYRLAMAQATHLHITHVDQEVEGCDAHFPAIDERQFEGAERRLGETHGVLFVQYRRVS
jgi:dihydrofolate reductase